MSAVMAQPQFVGGPARQSALYRERFCVAFGVDHPFAAKTAVPQLHRDMRRQPSLRRLNCEFREHLADL